MGGSFSLHENSIGHFCDSPYVDGLYDVSVHAASSLNKNIIHERTQVFFMVCVSSSCALVTLGSLEMIFTIIVNFVSDKFNALKGAFRKQHNLFAQSTELHCHIQASQRDCVVYKIFHKGEIRIIGTIANHHIDVSCLRHKAIQNKLSCIVADWRSNVELPVSKQNGKPVQNVERTLCQVHDIQPSKGQVIFV